MSDYHMAIFGGGSVGLCLAAHYVKAGARVSILVRKTSLQTLQGQEIEISGLLGEHIIKPGQFSLCDADAPDDDTLNADMLALTTKAYDVEGALQPFANAGRCPPVLMLQNGMGSAEIARHVLGTETPIYSTAMMIGMVRNTPTKIGVTAQSSPIQCGPLLGDNTEPLERMLDLAEDGFIPMIHDTKIRDTISFKLLFNTCMNPTGAITGQTYGELLENQNSRNLIAGLADETLAALAAAYDYRPAESGQHYVDDVLSPIIFPRSQGHKSSMLQDLQVGRKTEIDFLNGAIVRLANQAGLEATRHQSIVDLVKACERESGR